MKITRNELHQIMKNFCEKNPQFYPENYLYKDSGYIYSTKSRAVIGRVSATKDGKIRFSMVYDVRKVYLSEAGVTNNRVTADAEASVAGLIKAYNNVRARYNKIAEKVRPFIEKHHQESEKRDAYEKQVLHLIGTYGGSHKAKFFRENGSGTVDVNHDKTLDITVENVSLETIRAILELLGMPVEPKMPTDEFVRNSECLSDEIWDTLSEEERNKLRQSAFEDVYGKKN